MNCVNKYWTTLVGSVLHLTFLGGFLPGVTLAAAPSRSVPQVEALHIRIANAPAFPRRLVWVGNREPGSAESEALWDAIEEMRQEGPIIGIRKLELFIVAYPESSWTPSLRDALGEYYRTHGRYTLALGHWEKAWLATKSDHSRAGIETANYALVHWTHLLASLGRVAKLEELFRETRNRPLDAGPLQQLFNATKEGFATMKRRPGVAYRCGTYALGSVASFLKVTNHTVAAFADMASPESGFSMADLSHLSAQAGMHLTAVRRVEGEELIAPSVVHWKQNHYAAIVAKKDGYSKVIDPTFGKATWLSDENINAEASGAFLIPEGSIMKGWARLQPSESAQIFGKGNANNINDEDDEPCPAEEEAEPCPTCFPPPTPPPSPPPSAPPGGGPPGSPPPGCNSCFVGGPPSRYDVAAGMPTWNVSEPYINLWLRDKPLRYSASDGSEVSFSLSYKWRNTRENSLAFSVGQLWECNWLSYVTINSGIPHVAYLAVRNGGRRQYDPDGINREFKTRSTLTKAANGVYKIEFPSGAINVFGHSNSTFSGTTNYFLTQTITAQGRTNRFVYETTNSIVRLLQMIDADNRTNFVRYQNATVPQLITEVESPYGAKVNLLYDTNNYNQLTNIVDVIQLTNSLAYSSGGLVTNLTTPYGNTSFQISSNLSEDPFDLGGSDVNRSVFVLEPNGAKHLFAYVNDAHEAFPTNYPTGEIPDTSPFTNAFVNFNIDLKNSFYWGPRQYEALSDDFKTNDFNFYKLVKADYLKARSRRWHHTPYTATRAVGAVISHERFPSLDGASEGPKTWYDYGFKVQGIDYQGTNLLPTFVASVLPETGQHFVRYERDGAGRVLRQINTYTTSANTIAYRTNVFVYGTSGIDLIAQIEPGGHFAFSNIFNSSHLIMTNYNGKLEPTVYTYNAAGRVTSKKTPAGLTTTNIYFSTGDHIGWLAQSIDLEIKRTNSFSYFKGMVAQHTNELGLVVGYTWDALQRPTSRVFPDATTLSNQYSRLDLVATKDRLNEWTYFAFNNARQMTFTTNALTNVTAYSYCTCGSLESVTDPMTNTTTYTYDLPGRPITTTYADGSWTSNTFDFVGRLIRVDQSNGEFVTNYYNNQHLLVASATGAGTVLSRSFDIDDNIIATTNQNGVGITQTFDPLHRVLTRTYPDGGSEGFLYSSSGLSAYTNQLLDVTSYAYDVAGRRTNETDALQRKIGYSYDAAGDLVQLTKPTGTNIVWVYDAYGRVITNLDGVGQISLTNNYDANGRLTHRYSLAKGLTSYTYDKAGNLKAVNYPSSADLSFDYDGNDRLVRMVDGVGTHLYTYSRRNMVASEDGPWERDSVSLSYSNLHRASLVLGMPDASTWSQSYAYDNGGRLTNILSPSGTFGYTYDAVRLGEVARLQLGAASFVTNNYDSVARLTERNLKNSANSTFAAHVYTLNRFGQRTNQAFFNGNFVGYQYDRAGQLVTAKGMELGGTTNRSHEQFGYSYDSNGNLLYRTNNLLVQTFAVNGHDQLSSATRGDNATVQGVTTPLATNVTVNTFTAQRFADRTFSRTNITLSDGINVFTAVARDFLNRFDTNVATVYLPASVSYSYDGNGNMLSDGWRHFVWDDENQLIELTVTNATRSFFTYDGKMRRRTRTETVWQNGAWQTNLLVRYIYDGNLVVQERHYNPSLTMLYPQNVVTYTRGNDLSHSLEGAGGIGGLLSRTDTQSGVSAFYFSDGNGNVSALIDQNDATLADYRYDPFGNLLSSQGSLASANPYRFSSKEAHDQSGLVYYLYRYYDPSSQKWPNRDPLGEPGFETLGRPEVDESIDGPNSYAFILNDPLNRVDYLGLAPGGPYHPPSGVSLSCDPSDSCDRIKAKMTLLMRTIASHTGWDRKMPAPRGGGRHAGEIADFWRAYAKCQAMKAAKNCEDPKPPSCWERVILKLPGSDQTWERVATGCLIVGGTAACGALIVGTGGAAAPALAPALRAAF